MQKDLAVIQSQQIANGLAKAGGGDYNKIWIRDNVYVALAYMQSGHLDQAAKIYSELFKIIEKFQTVLDAKKYPANDSELIHPRYSLDGNTIAGPWSNKQHDAIGVLLFGVGRLFQLDTKYVSKDIISLSQKLINYLENCRYWDDKDNGIWEENPPVLHASSLAACVQGIYQVSSFCSFNEKGHQLAQANLAQLLPAESSLHSVDMALLSLIWPYGYKLVTLVESVESKLLKSKGVARYIGDKYESIGQEEPQWVMGIPWLGIAHFELGSVQKAKEYLNQTELLYTENGLPESYLANNQTCRHTPLAWSHAMTIVLRAKLGMASI